MVSWESRLEALEHAVTSMANGSTTLSSLSSPKDVVVVDPTTTVSASIPVSEPLPSAPIATSSAVTPDHKTKSGDWNLISKLRQQVETLKDTLFDIQKYETKTIHWRIPKIDKHLRLSSSTTFQSDPFYVGSIPFHLELQVQEATAGDAKDQSVSFFLYHHHWRTQYYHYQQAQFHLWPFQQDRAKRPTKSTPPPMQVGGSKLKIGEG